MAQEPDVTLGVDKAVQAATILQRSVVLTLNCHYLGNKRAVRMTDVDLADAETGEDFTGDKDQLGLSKQLLDRKLLQPVHHLFGAAKNYLRAVATSGHRVFGPSTYLIPLVSVSEVDAQLERFREDIAAAVETLVAAYPDAVEAQKKALGKMFDVRDYLSPAQVRHEFSMDWSYVSFSAPDKLVDVDMALAERATAKYEGKLSDAYDEVVAALRADALGMLTDLVDKLAPGPDGKPKVLRGTALADLQGYLARLPAKNSIAGDDALVQALAEVQAYAEGLEVDMLRKAPAVREALAEKAQAAADLLAGLVATGRRGIRLGGGGAEPAAQ